MKTDPRTLETPTERGGERGGGRERGRWGRELITAVQCGGIDGGSGKISWGGADVTLSLIFPSDYCHHVGPTWRVDNSRRAQEAWEDIPPTDT